MKAKPLLLMLASVALSLEAYGSARSDTIVASKHDSYTEDASLIAAHWGPWGREWSGPVVRDTTVSKVGKASVRGEAHIPWGYYLLYMEFYNGAPFGVKPTSRISFRARSELEAADTKLYVYACQANYKGEGTMVDRAHYIVLESELSEGFDWRHYEIVPSEMTGISGAAPNWADVNALIFGIEGRGLKAGAKLWIDELAVEGDPNAAPVEREEGRAARDVMAAKPRDALALLESELSEPVKPISPPITTPHTAWAKPYSRGNIKALFVVHHDYERDVVELAQRLSLDYKLLFIRPYEALYPRYSEIIHKALEEEQFEVLITCAIPFGDLSPQVSDKLIEVVPHGTGLVAIDPRNAGRVSTILPLSRTQKEPLMTLPPLKGRWERQSDHFITAGVPFAALPAAGHYPYDSVQGEVLVRSGNNAIVAVRDVGRGRVVGLGYSSIHPHLIPRVDYLSPAVDYVTPSVAGYRPPGFAYWEYYYSMLAKAIVWAACKEPEVSLRKVECPPHRYLERSETERGIPAIRRGSRSSCELEIAGKSGERLRIQAALRNELGEVETTFVKETSVPPSESVGVSFPLPAFVSHGLHLMDVVVRNRRGEVLDWGTASFEVNSDLVLMSLKTDKEEYRRGETVNVLLQVENKSHSPCPLTVCAELLDPYSRRVLSSRQSERVGARAVTAFKVTLKPQHLLTTFHNLRVRLLGDRGVMAAASVPVYVNRDWQERHSDYLLAFFNDWQAPHVRPHLDAMLRGIGIRGMVGAYQPSHWYRQLAESNLGIMPENIFPLGSTCREGVRERSLSDPAFLQDLEKSSEEFARSHRRYGILGYSIGEEMTLGGSAGEGEVDFGTHAQRAFREWVRREYRSLDNLNGEWGTRYDSWESVRPITWKEAMTRDNPAQWVDFRTFMEDAWTGAFRKFAEAVRRGDPGALTGYGGSQGDINPFSGYDYGRLAKECGFIVEYPSLTGRMPEWAMRMLSSLGKGKLLAFIGYDHTPEDIRYQSWWLPLHGAHGAVYFVSITAEQYRYWHYVYPTFAYTRNWRWLQEATHDLANGVGKLLVESHREDDGIAILHSQASMHTSWIESKRLGNASWRIYSGYRTGFQNLLKDLGLQFSYVTEDEVLSGQVRKHQVLLAPYALSLSPPVMQRLREFVRDGGTLVADLRTGVTDEHGKPYQDIPVIEQVFGIDRKPGENTMDLGQVKLSSACREGGPPAECTLTVRGKETIVLAGAKAWGEHSDGTPALTVNRLGKGLAIYLTFVPLRDESNAKLMDWILRMAGVVRRARVMNSSGSQQASGYEFTRFTRGRLEYVGVQRGIRRGAPAEKVTVHFGQKAHVYNVRSGQYSGRPEEVEQRFESGDAQVFALLPYRVNGLRLHVKDRGKPGELLPFKVQVLASKGLPEDHVLRLEVFTPQGDRCEAYVRNVEAPKGMYRGSIPLALNERAGRWKVRATDVISGQRAEAHFMVGNSLPAWTE